MVASLNLLPFKATLSLLLEISLAELILVVRAGFNHSHIVFSQCRCVVMTEKSIYPNYIFEVDFLIHFPTGAVMRQSSNAGLQLFLLKRIHKAEPLDCRKMKTIIIPFSFQLTFLAWKWWALLLKRLVHCFWVVVVNPVPKHNHRIPRFPLWVGHIWMYRRINNPYFSQKSYQTYIIYIFGGHSGVFS
jgi:hypothetical protein